MSDNEYLLRADARRPACRLRRRRAAACSLGVLARSPRLPARHLSLPRPALAEHMSGTERSLRVASSGGTDGPAARQPAARACRARRRPRLLAAGCSAASDHSCLAVLSCCKQATQRCNSTRHVLLSKEADREANQRKEGTSARGGAAVLGRAAHRSTTQTTGTGGATTTMQPDAA